MGVAGLKEQFFFFKSGGSIIGRGSSWLVKRLKGLSSASIGRGQGARQGQVG